MFYPNPEAFRSTAWLLLTKKISEIQTFNDTLDSFLGFMKIWFKARYCNQIQKSLIADVVRYIANLADFADFRTSL